MTDWDRIAKFAGLLGSQHDGEIAAAARMIDRTLKAEGLTWADLTARIRGGSSYAPISARTAREREQAARRPGSKPFSEQERAWESRMQDEEERARQSSARKQGRSW